MRRVSTYRANGPIVAREPFTTSGSLRGEAHTPGRWVHTGQLPREYEDSVREADYIVVSYSTPIAWHIPGEGWVKPDVRYSITTTKHQGQVYGVEWSPRQVWAESYRKTPRRPSSTGGGWG